MMLFNIKQCRWRSVALQEFEQRSESLLGAADRRRMTPTVCVHTQKTMCSNLKDIARCDAALRIRCATPFKRAYGTERLLSVLLLLLLLLRERDRDRDRDRQRQRQTERERERERAACASHAYNIYYGITV